MLYVRELWNSGKADGARQILARSFTQLPGNENLYIQGVDFEVDAGNMEQARASLATARASAATDRIYQKSAVLEHQMGNYEAALDLCNQGLNFFPSAWKIHALKGQIYQTLSKLKEAQEAYSIGTRANPTASVIYIQFSRLQEQMGAVAKARSTLDRARSQVPKDAALWCESVRLERRQGNTPSANKVMASALQEVPDSGLLWAEKIMHLESRTQRKPRALEAIKKVEDPLLFVVIVRIF
jgi:pre-mRNA-processing factor 6